METKPQGKNIKSWTLIVIPFVQKYFPAILLFLIFCFLFLYKIGVAYLDNWDEAWYASISREILRSKNFIQLNWNGETFVDHPPVSMWLTAISYTFLGISEFSSRFPSAFLGVLSIVLLYLLSYELFKSRSIAFISGLILGSCIWYITRVRSGNLDSTLVFFYLLTGNLNIRSSRNNKILPLKIL
jgi:4-amino-4-deoxy-L-arabinose transferase-like glycosyltransferase